MGVRRTPRVLLVLIVAITAAVVAVGQRTPAESTVGDERYRIRLGSADLVPEHGLHAVAATRGEPFLIQLHQVPGVAGRSRLEEAGVELLQYVGGGSYLARCEEGCGGALDSLARSTVDVTPAMRLAPIFDIDPDLQRGLSSNPSLAVVVRFFPWVPWEHARLVLEQSGAVSTATRLGYRSNVTATVGPESLRALLDRSEIAWIDPALPPTGPSLVNAAERSRVDQVRASGEFLGVDGAGTRVGVLDWFPDGIHADLEGRVTPVDVRWGEDDHGIQVSGCIAGAGILEPRARGMAPGASLLWTSWVPDPWSAMEDLHHEYGVTIVNNSWNTKPGWWLATRSWHGDLWAFGYYHERAAAADAVVRDTDLLVLFSAGNKREVSFLGPHTHGSQDGLEDGVWHEDLHPPNPRYRSIAGAAVAKNVLAVGGTTKEDESVYFSSLGPTDDGRVKPDLVAVGLDVLTTAAGDGYEATGGTSISSPVVAGVAALLSDFSRRRHERTPSSAVLKNLLIHSARDLGERGPDYISGFGMADAELAARVLDAAVFDDAAFRVPRRPNGRVGPSTPSGRWVGDAGPVVPRIGEMRSLVVETVLDHGETSTWTVPVARGHEELRATLVWHDPPGPELVNDLDLYVVAPDGRVTRPFVLEPDRPSEAAYRGVNHRDNVEHVGVRAPMAGRWRIVVEGTAVAFGPQELALIASAGESNRAPERLIEGDLVIGEFFVTGDDASVQEPSPWTVFHDDDPLNFYIDGTILTNADYGDFFGSITLTASVTDTDGNTVVRFSGAGHNAGPGPLEVLFAVGLEIPVELSSGSYTAHVELAMHNGVRGTADHPFSVEAIP